MKIIPLKEYHLLERLLGMTASDSDAEALTAIKKANKILKDHGFTWPELLRKIVGTASNEIGYEGDAPYEVDVYDRFNDAPKRNMNVDEAFAFMREKDVGDFQSFLTSIENFYRDKGYLTGKQKAALFKAVGAELKRAGT